MNNNNKTSEFDELQENLNRIDLLTKRLVLSLANKNNDSDYLDMLYREKFRFGTKDEIIIKLK